MRILERRRRLSKPERRPVLQCALPAIAWAAAVALYAVSLPDLAATPRRFPASPLAAIVAGLASAIEQFGLPTMWLVVFAGALLLSALLLPPDDRRTLRWLRQGWLGAAIGFIGGLPELPRGLLLMDVVLFGLSIEGLRSASTALVHVLATPAGSGRRAGSIREGRDRDTAI